MTAKLDRAHSITDMLVGKLQGEKTTVANQEEIIKERICTESKLHEQAKKVAAALHQSSAYAKALHENIHSRATERDVVRCASEQMQTDAIRAIEDSLQSAGAYFETHTAESVKLRNLAQDSTNKAVEGLGSIHASLSAARDDIAQRFGSLCDQASSGKGAKAQQADIESFQSMLESSLAEMQKLAEEHLDAAKSQGKALSKSFAAEEKKMSSWIAKARKAADDQKTKAVSSLVSHLQGPRGL